MKKILFCAAVAALATACTNEDDFVINQSDSRAQGLIFNVTLDEGATTKGEISKDENGKYPFMWYAETDRIDVLALNAEKGAGNNNSKGVATESSGAWDLTNGVASYKATQSAGAGLFTAADDANMLILKDYDGSNVAGTTATIVATYGEIEATTVKSKVANSKVVPGELDGLVLKTKAATGSNATQTVARPNVVVAPMYSISTAVKEKVYNSFGEKANLKLIRPFPVLRFTTKNTAEYIKDFGKLESVELTALGTVKTDGTFDADKASVLAYAAEKEYTVKGTKTGFENGYGATTNPEKVKVTLTDGTWTDNDAVYMTVAPVKREAKEGLKVEYSFEHITFTLDPSRNGAADFEKALQTSNDWTAMDANGNPNAVTPMPALDINNYNYLVTNVKNSNDRVLIVIKGNFNDIFKDANNVAWNGVGVPVTEFSKIISKVALTDTELGTIKKFTNLKDLTLAENTSIPASTFTTGQATAFKNLDLPKVTTIADDFAGGAFAALDSLKLPAYGFNKVAVNNKFFNNNVKTTLKVLDMSGVTSMMPTFGIERTMVFTGYAVLEKVTVKDNVIVAPSGFAGCKALETINGKLDIACASNAFAMTTSNENNALVSVEVCGTEIPDGAFTNCKELKTVKYNGNDVVPTAIGANAFENTVIENMDLSKAKVIGAAAFKGSTLKSTSSNVETLTVGVEKISASIFENCANLKMVKFTSATEIAGADVFKGATDLIQVKFEKVFKLADGAADIDYDNVFTSAPENIDFWTNPEQTGVSGSTLTLAYKKGTTASTKTYTFKSIQKRLD